MSARDKYHDAVLEVLEEHKERFPSKEGVETIIIQDLNLNHYLLYHIGWNGFKWAYSCPIHFSIKEKVYVQFDGTEYGVAEKLVEKGLKKEEVVLAYQHPSKRKYTEYAEA